MLLNQKSPHGGDIYTYPVRLDFSANTNPFGPPEAVRRALARAAERCAAYPDPYCTGLRAGIARAEGVSPKAVLCGNGAAELIYAFAFALPKDKKALIVSPTFCEYETALRAAGIAAEHYLLREEDGFYVTDDVLRVDFAQYGAVFLCSPNNPTGMTVDEAIIRALAQTGVRLFLDLTFLDLTDEPGKYRIPALLQAFPQLVILRAFTKSFAVAGVRLGYALCGDAPFLEKMSRMTQCWNVSSLAQAAGLAALDCGDWLRECVKAIAAERDRLTEELRRLRICVYPAKANYLLLYHEADLCGEMLKRGILLRDCADYAGLRRGFVRIAVRTKEENDALLCALREVLA